MRLCARQDVERHRTSTFPFTFRQRAPIVLLIAFATCTDSPHSLVAAFQDSTRGGIVRSPDGRPLSSVWVQELGTWDGNYTKADGRFLIPTDKPTRLLFVKDGYEPQLQATPGSANSGVWAVLLEPERAHAVVLRSSFRPSKSQFHELELARMLGLQTKRGREADFFWV